MWSNSWVGVEEDHRALHVLGLQLQLRGPFKPWDSAESAPGRPMALRAQLSRALAVFDWSSFVVGFPRVRTHHHST